MQIIIKRSNNSGSPSSLGFGEMAINSNNVLFVGNSANQPKILLSPNLLTVTSAYNLDFNASTVIANTDGGEFTITLPDLTSLGNIYDGFVYNFKNIASGTGDNLTIATFSNTQYIGSGTNLTAILSKNQYASYVGSVASMCWQRIN